jgi:hypothetical protein
MVVSTKYLSIPFFEPNPPSVVSVVDQDNRFHISFISGWKLRLEQEKAPHGP